MLLLVLWGPLRLFSLSIAPLLSLLLLRLFVPLLLPRSLDLRLLLDPLLLLLLLLLAGELLVPLLLRLLSGLFAPFLPLAPLLLAAWTLLRLRALLLCGW